jgi:hypothetical protein
MCAAGVTTAGNSSGLPNRGRHPRAWFFTGKKFFTKPCRCPRFLVCIVKSLHRGRPAYPWDAFHLEVAALLGRNELPDKKEAAIEHFRDWFRREHGIPASRSVVGEKLKPYYDRFLKGQKSR